MLSIKDLQVSVDGRQILRGLDLEVGSGEVHAIMGPNGSGKSTLAQVLAGRDSFSVDGGSVIWDGRDLLELATEERAREGLFLAFQYPVEIPGVSNAYFLKAAVNSVRRHRGEPELDAMDFLARVKQEMKAVGMKEEFLYRSVNEGFSGGEKKRNEVLQMAVLEPEVAILDETDSGLDIDALKVVARGVTEVRQDRPELGVLAITHYQRLLDEIAPDHVHVLVDGRIVASGGMELVAEGVQELVGPGLGVLLITHYQRMLNYITPDRVHVMMRGRIVQSGGPELAHELEAKGYEGIRAELGLDAEATVEVG